ncbi:hypothetical protein FHY18_000048 [Xanthomonas arboricola]|nr:hypothetical protein [Xanthomonas sp. 3793]
MEDSPTPLPTTLASANSVTRSTILERKAHKAIDTHCQIDRLELSYAPPSGMGAASASCLTADNG